MSPEKEKASGTVVTVARTDLPVREQLMLQKMHYVPEAEDAGKRICLVTGIHGDELEGQLVAYQVNRRIQEHPEFLHGTVDIYPAMNPLGINTIKRGIPGFDLDMNRTFPGDEQGSMIEYFVNQAFMDMEGADFAIDLHASNIFLRELPQVRISEETEEMLLPYAQLLNLDFIWIHGAATVLQSTLAHSLNDVGTRCLVVEMGVGMRLTQEYASQVTEGIFNLMRHEGIWEGPTRLTHFPVTCRDQVEFLNANAAGIFIPSVQHDIHLKKGQTIGVIADPLTGTDRETIKAPQDGLLFTLREYPVVYPGSLLGRIFVSGPKARSGKEEDKA
ncbi:MAG TPA: succinylglutamate desuccinylase [Lachnospiraceae bacterium]|jgi:predicted deacylase|nr:succinylglutamate desuccinylase [Lachnospiraceae bacterium]